MMHDLRRFAAATLAILIACPAPSLWAGGTVANPAATRGAVSGVSMPIPVVPSQQLSGPSLGGIGRLSAPSLPTGLAAVPQVSPSALLTAPVVSPTADQIAGAAPIAALPQLGISPQALASMAAKPAPASNDPQAPTAQKVAEMSREAYSFLEAAGPVAQASGESAQVLGGQVFKALSQEAAAPGEALPGDPTSGPAAAPAASLTQQKMLATLYQVAAIFAEQYAPIDWKKQQFQLDLKREYDKAKAAILADPKITTQQFQDLLAALVGAMRDYHVSISFDSTERARLPFLVTGAGGKYFLSYIDREQLPLSVFPFRLGDEVVTFDGKPTGEAVAELAARMGGNTAETDQRMAELFLTNRRRARGDHVPQGDVQFSIRSKDGTLTPAQMAWDYLPELVPQDVPVRDATGGLLGEQPGAALPEAGIEDRFSSVQADANSLKSLLGRVMAKAVHPLASVFEAMRAEAAGNPFMIGARKSFVPRLGELVWESKDEDAFHAYIFKTKDGRKVGFVRIASYEGGAKEAKAFGALMAKFQKQTDALVIDQVNNPGGDVFYLYTLVSHLTDKPMVAPHHRLIIGSEMAHWAAELLLKVMQPQTKRSEKSKKADAEEADGDEGFSGYPISQKFLVLMVKFAQFILKQFDSGKRFTDLTWLWGVDEIDPAPDAEQRYTKPVLLLTNELDFSGGDFLPAILQDNKRVTQMGVRTAGAGGMVKPYQLPNQFGIADVAATWSIAERANGKPIENLGVTPDIPYSITEKDLRTGFAEYRLAIIKALEGLLGPAAAPAPAPAPAPAAKTKSKAKRSR